MSYLYSTLRKSTQVLYNKDFDFNQSSDQVLLNQVVVQELLLRRLEKKRLSKSVDVEAKDETIVKDLGEQYRKNLSDLGVSRKQRVEFDQSIEGNVAQLSSNVEQKMDNIKNLLDMKKRNLLITELTKEFEGVSKQEHFQQFRKAQKQVSDHIRGQEHAHNDAE